MRSGSSAHDGHGWSPAQHPYPGRGPQSEREDVSFGPETSWPSGARQMEFDSGEYRQLVESSYDHVNLQRGGAPGYQPAPGHQPGPRYQPDPGRGRGHQRASGYQQPAIDDYGYGDPGYADPSYDGPRDRGGYPAGTAQVPARPAPAQQVRPAYQGYQPPWPGDPMEPDPIYPVTGAQEIYREPDSEPEPRAADPRPADPRPADPRLAGLRYDELRYDDSESSGDPRYGERRYDEPLDDEAWYAELRRSGPAYPQRPSGPQGPGEPVGQPGPGRLAGAVGGPPQAAGYDRSPGYPLGNGPGPGPRLSAAPGTAPVLTRPVGLAQPGVSTQPGFGTRPVPMAPQGSGYQATPTFSPPAPVGVLTPPVGSRFEARADTPQARPSAVITGPDTTAWDAAPDAELGSLEEYWQEEGSYSALLEEFDDEAEAPSNTGTAAMESARRAIGRRRGRNSDHRLWLGLGGVVVVAAAAIFGIIKFEFPSNNGPAHEFVMPAKIAGYERASSLEKNSDLPALVRKFSKMLGVPASSVVSREYESNAASTVTVGTQTQIVMFIGAHLPNQSPANSLHAFIQQDKGAQVVNAGLMGGEAACVETPQPAALCAWFDNDSVGVVLSPTMSTGQLPGVMLTFRPQVEQVKK